MRVIIDNSIVKEIVNLLVKNKAIIDDFAEFTDLTGFGDYHITSYGIDNLSAAFYRNENNYKCHNPSILENLGLPERVYFDRLLIKNIETAIQHKEKSQKELAIFLQETYYKAIKDLLKNSDYPGYQDFIYISEYQIDEPLNKVFENIKFKHFNSFREFVEQYCNSFKYLEDSWVIDAFDSIDIDELNNPVAIEPNDVLSYLEELDSMLKDANINKYNRKYHGLKISEIEVLECSTANHDYNILLDIEGNAHISVDCDIEVGYKFYVSKPKDFIEDDEFGSWGEYLSDILQGCLSPEEYFEDNGYCEREESIKGTISLIVKDKIIVETNLYNYR